MIALPSIQRTAATLHQQRYPDADARFVAMQAMEDLGSLACSLISCGDRPAGSCTCLPEDAVHVVSDLLALIGRWWPEVDLLAEVETRLTAQAAARALDRPSSLDSEGLMS